jgi:hypothetical protein
VFLEAWEFIPRVVHDTQVIVDNPTDVTVDNTNDSTGVTAK